MKYKLLPVFTITLLIYLPFTPLTRANSEERSLNHEQAQTAMHAVGQVYLREQMTFTLLADCASEFKHLAESADHAKTTWLRTNTATIEKSRRIQDIVARSIQEQKSDFGAVKFTLDIETLIHNSVTSFRSELAGKPRKQRHYVCNRLILSITAGEWDLHKQVADAVTTITEFQEEDHQQ